MNNIVVLNSSRYEPTGAINVGDAAQFFHGTHILRKQFPLATITLYAHSIHDEALDDSFLDKKLVSYISTRKNDWPMPLRRLGALVQSVKLLLDAQRIAKKKKPKYCDKHGLSILKELETMDLVFFCGAGLLNDVYINNSALFIWVLTILIASKLGVPVVMIGQQIGPLHRLKSRLLIGMALRKLTFLGVRDGISLVVAKSLGVRSERISNTGDEGLYLPPSDPTLTDAYLQKNGIVPGYLAVQFRIDINCPFESQINTFSSLVKKVSEMMGIKQIVLIPFFYAKVGDDREACKMLATIGNSDWHVVDVAGDPQLTKGILSKARVAIGVANHFCIFALSVGVPTIGIYTTPYMEHKLSGIAKAFSNFMALPIDDLGNSDHALPMILDHFSRSTLTQSDHCLWQKKPLDYYRWFDLLKG